MHGWMYLNTDGAAKMNRHVPSYDGVICDCNGKWTIVFTRYLGHTSTYMA